MGREAPRLVGGRKRPRRLWRVVDREALPSFYLKVLLDTLAIRRALARGEEVPGVERMRRASLAGAYRQSVVQIATRAAQ